MENLKFFSIAINYRHFYSPTDSFGPNGECKINGGSQRTCLPTFVSINNCVFANIDGDFSVVNISKISLRLIFPEILFRLLKFRLTAGPFF